MHPLERAWSRTDRLFALLEPAALLHRPIALRQPFLFYLGHLPAFAWNQVARGALSWPSFRPDLDALFERGIDPVDTEEPPPDDPSAWPGAAEVGAYRDRVRDRLRGAFGDPRARAALDMATEHELMHHETLLYMVCRLDHGLKRPPARERRPAAAAAEAGRVAVPAGPAALGRPRGAAFGWDNEYDRHEVAVPGFEVDRRPVTNRDFAAFVRAGGYGERRLWTEEAWTWLARTGRTVPPFWRADPDGARCRTAFADVPFEEAADWPVYATFAEAAAYACFAGGRLLTEPEYHRAAFGTPDGPPRAHPWGDAPPADGRGNFGFRSWTPVEVGSGAASAWGVCDLVGNGWEWTATPFAPLPGFAPHPTYPRYSADFFDGRHYVLKGASWATDDQLVRASFRNWFQPHYPHVFAQFRTAAA